MNPPNPSPSIKDRILWVARQVWKVTPTGWQALVIVVTAAATQGPHGMVFAVILFTLWQLTTNLQAAHIEDLQSLCDRALTMTREAQAETRRAQTALKEHRDKS